MRHGGNEFGALGDERGVLLLNFCSDVPRQDEYIVRRICSQGAGGQDGDMAARHEFSLFGGGGVADEGQQIGFDAGVIEQGIAFGSGAVGRDFIAGAFLFDQKAEQVVFHSVSTCLEVLVGGQGL